MSMGEATDKQRGHRRNENTTATPKTHEEGPREALDYYEAIGRKFGSFLPYYGRLPRMQEIGQPSLMIVPKDILLRGLVAEHERLCC